MTCTLGQPHSGATLSDQVNDPLSPQGLAFPALAASCLAENSLRTSGETHRFEMFRRAISLRDERAWGWLYHQYHALARSWVTKQFAAAGLTVSQEDGEGFVNEAFARFNQSIPAQKWGKFPTIAALLKYLKSCVRSAVLDHLRHARSVDQHCGGALEDLLAVGREPEVGDHAEAVVSSITVGEVWQIIQEEINDQQERVVLYCLYWLEMQPAEILQAWPSLFATVKDVYRVKRNVLDKVRRMRWLRWYLTGGRRADFRVVPPELARAERGTEAGAGELIAV